MTTSHDESLSREERPTTTVVELLERLRELGVTISLSETGDRLRIAAPRGALSAELRLRLSEEKAAVDDFLRQVRATSAASEDDTPGLTRIPRPADGDPGRVGRSPRSRIAPPSAARD